MIDDTASVVNAADWKLSSNNTSTKEREKTRFFTFTRPSSPSTLLRPYPLYLPDFGGGEGVAVNVTSVTLTCLCFFGSIYTRRCYRTAGGAGVAQLVEQLTCNQQVGGSIPFASSSGPSQLKRKSIRPRRLACGGMPEWLKGTGCKPVGLRLPRFES